MVAFFVLNLFVFFRVCSGGSRITCKVELLEGVGMMRRLKLFVVNN